MYKILLVDDAQFMRMTIKRILAESEIGEIKFEEAGDGNEALEKYIVFQPDLVTMDITMPECDGLEGLKKIKEYDPKAKVIMVSAMGQQPMIIDAITHGAKDFIVKPFQEDAVIAKVKGALGLS